MPLLTRGNVEGVGSRPVQIGDLPLFNNGEGIFVVHSIDGWDSTAAPDAVLVANGGGAGSVASGPWLPQQAGYVVTGKVIVEPAVQVSFRKMIIEAFPADRDTPLIVYGDPSLQAFCRRMDRLEFFRQSNYMAFSLPLVAGDPYKYGLVPLSGSLGVWTGEEWYEAMQQPSAGLWAVQMSVGGSTWSVSLAQDVPTGPYPLSLTLDSDGDAQSSRVTVEVTGPLDAGDWFLWSETTNTQCWAEVSIADGQTLVIDAYDKSATMSGSDVTHLMYGDWPVLSPGQNTFRLAAGTDSSAYCEITALEAYE